MGVNRERKKPNWAPAAQKTSASPIQKSPQLPLTDSARQDGLQRLEMPFGPHGDKDAVVQAVLDGSAIAGSVAAGRASASADSIP